MGTSLGDARRAGKPVERLRRGAGCTERGFAA